MANSASAVDGASSISPRSRRRDTGQSISDTPTPCPESVSRAARSSLLESSKYSDVTLICEGQEIKAHKFVLCARSPMWAAACDGQFLEARTGRIDVGITDLTTLNRILNYLYEDRYDDESEVKNAKASDENDGEEDGSQAMQAEHQQREESSEEQSPESEAVTHFPNNFKYNPDDYVLHEVPEEDACNCAFCNGPNGEGIRPSFQRPGYRFIRIARSNKVLINNIRVYAAADYYQILDLKQVAKEKFLNAADHYDLSGYDYLVEEVYGLTSARIGDEDLRETVAAMPGDLAWQLRFERRFNVRALAIQEFAEDFMGRLAEDKDDQRTRICTLQTTVEQQKKQIEQQKKVNDAKVKSLEKALEQQRRQTEQQKKENIMLRDRERYRASTPTVRHHHGSAVVFDESMKRYKFLIKPKGPQQQQQGQQGQQSSAIDTSNIPSLPPISTPPRLNLSNRPVISGNRPASGSTSNVISPPNPNRS
ncbi:MAG: hypothetical protein M1831_007456 [Alyxoria varia]|nr:MAG: hypothetical protein M1831_007456 [Alyxoria varia]